MLEFFTVPSQRRIFAKIWAWPPGKIFPRKLPEPKISLYMHFTKRLASSVLNRLAGQQPLDIPHRRSDYALPT